MTVKQNFLDEIEFLKDLCDKEITQHLAKAATNATYRSHFRFDEPVKIISNFLKEKVIQDVITNTDLTVFLNEYIDEVDW